MATVYGDGIVISGSDGVEVGDNVINGTNDVGIHLVSGVDATLEDNEVASSFGVWARLESVPPPCPDDGKITVDNAPLESNIVTGDPAPDILCDVSTYTATP